MSQANNIASLFSHVRATLAEERANGRARMKAMGLSEVEIDAALKLAETMHQQQLDGIADKLQSTLDIHPAPGVH